MADIKWSAFPTIGALATGDTLVGLRAGANVKFNTLTIPWTVANGGTGLSTTTAYSLIAAGTTATGNFQAVGTGAMGQLLQSGGAGALPTWTTPTFPSGSGTLNHMLRSDGTNWVQTTATTLDASDVLSGLTQLNVDNLRLDGNTISSTDTDGNVCFIPNGAGNALFNVSTPLVVGTGSANTPGWQKVSSGANVAFQSQMMNATFVGASGSNQPSYLFVKSRATIPGSFSALSSGDQLGSILWLGDDGTQYKSNVCGITSQVDGAVSAGIVPGKINFFTQNSAGSSILGMSLSAAQILTLTNPLPLASGGTNASLTASNGGIVYSTATTLAVLAGTATAGQLLRSGASAAPTWTTSTYPATNAVNTLLYASSANVMAALATANSGVLITSAGGVPSISSTLPTLVQQNSTVMGTNSAVSITASAPASSLVMDANGYVTTPKNPGFLAYVSSGGVSNVTGNGVSYTVILDSTVYNVGSGYSTSTGLFTLPVAGTYTYSFSLTLMGLTALTNVVNIFIVAGGNTFPIYQAGVPTGSLYSTSYLTIGGSITLSRSVSNTAALVVRVDGGTQTVSLAGNAGVILGSWFTGRLIG